MFERDRQSDYPMGATDKETILSDDTRFKGSLEFSHKLIISGYFEGNLNSKGTLLVGKSGQVKAEIKVGSIIIEGKVWGNILADDKIELRSSAELYGDIKANRLTINEGATFIGKCDVNPNRKETAQSTQSAQSSPIEKKPQPEIKKEVTVEKTQEKSKEPLFGGSMKY